MIYKGDIAGFPTEVVEKMLERQVEQGNERDVRVFEICRHAGRHQGGFSWSLTIERDYFWDQVSFYKNFSLFFERYPKTEK